ncbi:MAG: PA2778 family cysteine peptidase [Xanthomonadales bacterium]|nr:PA2778 family cysteine peptidase [Xanthomonadales bacterium]
MSKPMVSLDTPFFPQTENQCGPAALATVLTAAGAATSPEDLTAQVYLPAREGSLQVELLAATRRHDRIPFTLDPQIDALLVEVSHGRPVLVLQNLRTRSLPAWHYAVLVGYDAQRNALQLNSGTEEGLWVEAPTFLRTWDWGGRWAMMALSPGEVPATLRGKAGKAVERYFRAIADFEAVAGAAAASPAWQIAAAKWPGHRWPTLALGNQAYESGNREGAMHWYRQGLAANPQDPALANNLASVLGEAGCARAGEAVLRPVAAGLDSKSAWHDPIESTLRDLAAHKGPDPDACARLSDPRPAVAAVPAP